MRSLLREKRVGEISTAWANGTGLGGLRTSVRQLRRTFWPTTPNYAGTKISYAKTRTLYRNDDPKANLGAGIVRRVINARSDFMELPFPATGDELVDEFLGNCIHTYWAPELTQMIRDACRDADTVVRIRRHSSNNKLVSPEEWEACYLEILPPERVSIIYKTGGDRREIEVAYVRHEIEEMIEGLDTSARSVSLPQMRQKVIIEEITPEYFRYYDQSEGKWREDLAENNTWGFVPLHEVNNEFDASLEGGQSDLEAPLPFILALHDVIAQSLQAHKAHSTPKVKLSINSMEQFLANNFPESFEADENGNPIPGTFTGNVSWKGSEILFLQSEEDAGFLEAQSVLGDSKVLADFLIDMIAISAETPRSILMAEVAGEASDFRSFAKMINRKRTYFMKDIQHICKMVLAINFMSPVVVPFFWDELSAEEALVKSQALQQRVMAGEVLATREVISDRTLRADLRRHIPHMKGDSQEKSDAASNKQIEITSGASVSGSDSGVNE